MMPINTFIKLRTEKIRTSKTLHKELNKNEEKCQTKHNNILHQPHANQHITLMEESFLRSTTKLHAYYRFIHICFINSVIKGRTI